MVVSAAGTGTTLAGLIAGMPDDTRVIGIPVLKGGQFLVQEVRELLRLAGVADPGGWHLETDYHFGGYGKQPPELMAFTRRLNTETGIPFEPVYTGKMMWGLLDLVSRERFDRGDTILAIHTGGVFPES